ncbi:MAG: hypothetical protein ACKVOJ_08980 [Sphingomonadaceae bacterium]
MSMLADLFRSGHIADLVIAVMVVEALILILIIRRPLIPTLSMLVPGAFMMLALRAALTGSGWEVVALWISASLPAHLFDIWQRKH